MMTMTANTCLGFPPNIDEQCHTLILGSMPGISSLRHQQYYAHPQNRFWPLMFRLLTHRKTVPDEYSQRLQLLLRHHIALWDSIDTCLRSGSLDTAIEQEKGNDFQTFLAAYPHIHTICFNGQKSYQVFRKNNRPLISCTTLQLWALPSTSPAKARFTLADLQKAWQPALQHCLQCTNM